MRQKLQHRIRARRHRGRITAKRTFGTMAAAMALGSMAIAGVLSTAQAGMPPVQHQGTVEYVSGGIGIDESEAMKAASSRDSTPLHPPLAA